MKKWIITNNYHTILYAKTQDEIRRVYEHGPASCMSHKKNRFFEEGRLPHPVEAYAGGRIWLSLISIDLLLEVE